MQPAENVLRFESGGEEDVSRLPPNELIRLHSGESDELGEEEDIPRPRPDRHEELIRMYELAIGQSIKQAIDRSIEQAFKEVKDLRSEPICKSCRSASRAPVDLDNRTRVPISKSCRSASRAPVDLDNLTWVPISKSCPSASRAPVDLDNRTRLPAESPNGRQTAICIGEAESPNGRQTATWITEAAKKIGIPKNFCVDRRSPSIFRVPNFLKESEKEKAYVPKIVSLGPYHHGRGKFFPMQNHKKRALRRMMTRFNHTNDPEDLEFSFRAIDEISQEEDKIRNSYDEKIHYKKEYLAVMLTLDGCFILEILRSLGNEKLLCEASNCYEPIFDGNRIDYTGFDILNDFLMLENQIPLIVLRKLLELEFGSVDVEEFLFNVLVKAPGIKFYPFEYEDIDKWSWSTQAKQIHHFLGLLHTLIVSPPSYRGDCSLIVSSASDHGDEPADQIHPKGKKKSGNDVRCIPSAVELSNAGIKFMTCNGGIKEIKFDPNRATIQLPPISVTDHTEVLFRNLIALELCMASKINYVTCYLSLMDKLIDSKEDVVVLKNSKVVKNYLGSDEEVVELFNGLCQGVTVSQQDFLETLQEQVTEHYENKFKVWLAELTKKHFSSPWTFLALTGAILALVLTIVQTIFSILSYK